MSVAAKNNGKSRKKKEEKKINSPVPLSLSSPMYDYTLQFAFVSLAPSLSLFCAKMNPRSLKILDRMGLHETEKPKINYFAVGTLPPPICFPLTMPRKSTSPSLFLSVFDPRSQRVPELAVLEIGQIVPFDSCFETLVVLSQIVVLLSLLLFSSSGRRRGRVASLLFSRQVLAREDDTEDERERDGDSHRDDDRDPGRAVLQGSLRREDGVRSGDVPYVAVFVRATEGARSG